MSNGRYSFAERREMILESLGKLRELRDRGYDDFASDWTAVDSAAMRVAAVGEMVGPGSGHATPATSRIFHRARNRLAHDYYRFTPKELWG